MKGILEPIIFKAKSAYNISDESVAECKRKECDEIREPFELLLLAPIYIFMDEKRIGYTGAGHFMIANDMQEQKRMQYIKDMTDAVRFGTGAANLPREVFAYAPIFNNFLADPDIHARFQEHPDKYYKDTSDDSMMSRMGCNQRIYASTRSESPSILTIQTCVYMEMEVVRTRPFTCRGHLARMMTWVVITDSPSAASSSKM